MDETRIQALIDELDRLAPRDGAVVRLHDGTDEGRYVLEVEGNRGGYVQLGLVFLRAAFTQSGATPGPKGDEIYADRPDIVDDESSLQFGEFRRWEQPPPRSREEASSLTSAAMGVGCLAVGGVLLLLLLAGLVKVVETLR
jgi:hypothetical protein